MNQPPESTVPAPPSAEEEAGTWLYIPMLLFVILIVAVALLLPCVVALQTHRLAALVALSFFFPLPTAGYAYLWRFGYLDWPRPGPVAPHVAAKPHRDS